MALTSILAPVDFSEDSVRGAGLARDIARRHSARLTLLHVDGLPIYDQHVTRVASPEAWADYFERRDVALERRLREFAEGLQCKGDVHLALARGDAAEAILEHAREKACDLIVVSPRGAGYGHQFLLGSVSARLATDAPRPVLVARVRSRATSASGAFLNPLIAVSNHQLAECVFKLALELAQRGSNIRLLDVLEPSEVIAGPPLPGGLQDAVQRRRDELTEQLALLAESFPVHELATSVFVDAGEPSFTLLRRIESENPGLVVVSRKVRADGRGVLSPSAYRMVKYSPVPVLIVPAEAP